MAKFYDRNPNQKDDYVSDGDDYYIHSENTNASKTVLNEDYSNSNISKTVSNEDSNNPDTNPYDWRSRVKTYDGLNKVIKVVIWLLFAFIFIVFVVRFRIQEINKQEDNITQQVQVSTKEQERVVDTSLRDKLARLGGSMQYALDENKETKEFWEPDRTATYQSIGDNIYADNTGRVYILSGALSNIRKCKIGTLQGWICTITYNGESKDIFVNRYYHYNSNDGNQGKVGNEQSYLNVIDTVNIYNDYNLVLTQDYYTEYYRKRAKETAKVESKEYKEKFDKKNYSEDLLTEQELLDLYMTCDWCYYDGTLWEMSDDIETVSITFEEMKKMNTETCEWVKSWAESYVR